MDVSAPRPSDTIDTVVRRPERGGQPARAVSSGGGDTPQRGAPAERWMPPSMLKFTLTAADVDARFEIHQATSTVTVTMYDRETGEVLREVPSRDVLDVIASLASTGLRVDVVT